METQNTNNQTTTTKNETATANAKRILKPLAERLAIYEAKAAKTYNRQANFEGYRHNAFDKQEDIIAAEVIIDNNAPAEAKAEAFEYLHRQFMAAFNNKVREGHPFEANFSAIKAEANKPELLAEAVKSDGFRYSSAIILIYRNIRQAEKAAKAAKWIDTLNNRQAKAEAKAEKAAKFADKASRSAAIKAAKARKAAEAAKNAK